MNSTKPWALVVLCLLVLISPVIAKTEEIVETGYKFEDRALYWEPSGRADAVLLSLFTGLTSGGLTTTEAVAIVIKTPAGRFEVIGGKIEADRFVIETYIGTVTNPSDAPLLVLGWLTGRKKLG